MIFPEAKNTQISGGQFSVIHNNVVNQRTNVYRNETDLLREYCALGALLDSNERFDPPRCAAETREALIQEILAWIYGSEDCASMTWLYGGAGAGKSALAQTIAEICQREGRLAGSFFFSRTSTADRSDGDRLIPTLVFQLLEAFPELKPFVEKSISKHAGIFDRSPRTQMDLLFIKPFTSLKQAALPIQMPPASLSILPNFPTPSAAQSTPASNAKPKSRRRHFMNRVFGKLTTKVDGETGLFEAPPQHQSDIITTTAGAGSNSELAESSMHRLIVIDGLDECNGQAIQSELLRILATAIPLLPFPFRFLVASRPEGNIMRTINYDQEFQSIDVRKIDLGDDANADDDIRRFLERGFKEIRRVHRLRSLLDPSWPSGEAIATLVKKSSAHFIYASTAMKYVQYSRGRPDKRLEVILGLSAPPTTDKPFAQLDALYTYIFMSMEEPDRATVIRVFGILVLASRQDFGYTLGGSPARLEEYLNMQTGEIELLLEPLLSLVVVSENRETDIKILHASLFDFLQDSSRSGDLHLNIDIAHSIISEFWLKDVMKCTIDKIQPVAEPSELKSGVDERIDLCWRLLCHCYSGRVSDKVEEYLHAFPFLYDVLLHPKSPCITDAKTLSYIPILLQLLFTVLVEKDLNEGKHWHEVHATQVEQRFRSLHEGSALHLHDDIDISQEPLFKDNSDQNLHLLYKAFLEFVLATSNAGGLYDILEERNNRYGPGNTEENVRAHFLVISLPYLASKYIGLCQRYSALTSSSDDELRQVLQRRVEGYLQRVGNDVDASELKYCKEAWRIE